MENAAEAGIAPKARVVFMDLERYSNSDFNVPVNIGSDYFDRIRRYSNVRVISSSWSSPTKYWSSIDSAVDNYLHSHSDVLAVFPSGNDGEFQMPTGFVHAPCKAKNSLCVGSTFNTIEQYSRRPTFAASAIQINISPCPADAQWCSKEIVGVPALFGETVSTVSPAECAIQPRECAYRSSALKKIKDREMWLVEPEKACSSVGTAHG